MNEKNPQIQNESIFFVTLPKSGTVFTWETLKALTGLASPALTENAEEWRDYTSGLEYKHSTIYASGDFATQRLLPDRLAQYLPNGYVFGAHMLPVYHNMKALEAAGVDRILVTLRDPRDATVSWVHQVIAHGPNYANYQSKIYPLTPGFSDLPHADQVAYHVRTFLPMAITWVESWLDYYANPERKLDVLFVYFDELKSDPIFYFGRILRFLEKGPVNSDLIARPEKGRYHYREGRHGAWEKEFSDGDKLLSYGLILDRLTNAYSRAVSSLRNRIVPADGLRQDDSSDKLNGLLSVLEQFPGDTKTAQMSADLIRQMGAPEPLIMAFDQLAAKKTTTASIFLSPPETRDIIKQAQKFLGTVS